MIHILGNSKLEFVSFENSIEFLEKAIEYIHEEEYCKVLIVGALIVGLSNENTAIHILKKSPKRIQGVAYFDKNDRIQVILRDHKNPIPLVQCGVDLEHLFVYLDGIIFFF